MRHNLKTTFVAGVRLAVVDRFSLAAVAADVRRIADESRGVQCAVYCLCTSDALKALPAEADEQSDFIPVVLTCEKTGLCMMVAIHPSIEGKTAPVPEQFLRTFQRCVEKAATVLGAVTGVPPMTYLSEYANRLIAFSELADAQIDPHGAFESATMIC